MRSLNMEDSLSLYPRELSGGMVRRVAIARAMVYEPELILYDEPTTGLDPISTRQVVDLMRHMLQTHQHTIFIVTHELHNFVGIVNRMLFIQKGAIVYDGQVDTEIFDRLGESD